MPHLEPVDLNFLFMEIDADLLESYIALSNAAKRIKFVEKIGSELDIQIAAAMEAVNLALKEIGSDVDRI